MILHGVTSFFLNLKFMNSNPCEINFFPQKISFVVVLKLYDN